MTNNPMLDTHKACDKILQLKSSYAKPIRQRNSRLFWIMAQFTRAKVSTIFFKRKIVLLILFCSAINTASAYPVPSSTRTITYLNEQFKTHDGLILHGHLAIPVGKNRPFPLVIMLTGSGNVDRYENIPGSLTMDGKTTLFFKNIERGLVQQGIAVFMYDKRGIVVTDNNFKESKTTPDYETAGAKNLAADAIAAFDFASKLPQINSTQIALLGHSEGTILALKIIEQRPQVKALFLLSVFNHSLKEIMSMQMIYQRLRLFNLLNTAQDDTLTAFQYQSFAKKAGKRFLVENRDWNQFYQKYTQLHQPGKIIKAEYTYINEQVWLKFQADVGDKNKPWNPPPHYPPRIWFKEYFSESDYLARQVKFCKLTYVFQGELDPEVPFEDALRLRNSCTAAGTQLASFNHYPQLGHFFSPYTGYKKWHYTMGPMELTVTHDIINSVTKTLKSSNLLLSKSGGNSQLDQAA